MGNLIKPHEHKKKKKRRNTISWREREAETKHTQSVGQNLQTFVVGGKKKVKEPRTKNEYG